MADGTHIEWTDATWNPVTGCSVISPGCQRCYAMKLAGTRLQHHPSRAGLTVATKTGPVWNGEVMLNEQWIRQPMQWRRPRRIFVCAHGDLFHENVPDAWIDTVFAVMALAPQHTFQVLTKRPERMREYMTERWQPAAAMRVGSLSLPSEIEGEDRRDQIARECEPFLEKLGLADPSKDYLWTADGNCKAMQWEMPLPNVWLGVSVEDQERKSRIDTLRDVPAALRFLSLEPLLENLGKIDLTGIGWVIAGGESGDGARPMHPEWVRSIRDQCVMAGVPFHFKQWGEWLPTDQPGSGEHVARERLYLNGSGAVCHGSMANIVMHRVGKRAAGAMLDGREWREFPAAA